MKTCCNGYFGCACDNERGQVAANCSHKREDAKTTRSIPDQAMDMSARRMAEQFHATYATCRFHHSCSSLDWLDEFDPDTAHGRALIATFREMLAGNIKSMFER